MIHFFFFFFKKWKLGVPVVAQWKQIRLVSIRMRVWALASLSVSGIQHCCELWYRSLIGFGSMLLWQCLRLAAAAPIWSLAWELLYVVDAALKSKKKKKSNKCSDSLCQKLGTYIPRNKTGLQPNCANQVFFDTAMPICFHIVSGCFPTVWSCWVVVAKIIWLTKLRIFTI